MFPLGWIKGTGGGTRRGIHCSVASDGLATPVQLGHRVAKTKSHPTIGTICTDCCYLHLATIIVADFAEFLKLLAKLVKIFVTVSAFLLFLLHFYLIGLWFGFILS